ncbi:MAG: indoleamine 2,3-dioxygenase [Nostocaceae cyanobacterium]|nr:indoleamine 2,3-dioxygenase [Nostocaceae cyanobacterium]
MIHDLAFYEIDLVRGFLPKEDPLECLPSEFKAWECIASEVSVLLMTDKLRSSLEKLSPPKISRLENEGQIRRAFLLLSVFGNAYVWGGRKPATKIPHTIAVPWWELAEKLDRPPIICHASMALDNWRRLDKSQSLELDNLAVLQFFLGGIDEQWFYTTNIMIEAKGAPAIVSLVEAQKFVITNKIEGVVQELQKIALALADMYTILLRIPEKCDPYIFYHRVRPFVAGWQEPGVIYEGISDTPKKFVGGSAAQSSLIQSLDAGLGIKHQEERQLYLHQMRSYMPPGHRKFIQALETESSIREFVLSHKQNYPFLCEQYNNCIQALENFRKKHMQIAVRYIARHAPENARGTGGTDFIHFLQQVKQETAAHLIA